ncbi:hypothetical protein TWF506_004699 [Arthrobotrys conoides]|uniref:F-box domain-containing protein n=1 Tax=Arthrobotrys conoides TaxID=74498 RepID=A0AAN8RI59_9PEZI
MPTTPCSQLFIIPEILELILQHVPPLELLGSCRAVNLTWNSVISTSWLLKYYSITGLNPQQRLSAISHLQLTPAARSILSLFWKKLHGLLIEAEPGDPDLSGELYKLYTSFRHPLQKIVVFQPPPGHQQSLEFYKIIPRAPFVLQCHDRDEEGRRRLAFKRLFSQNNGYEEIQAGTYPLQNIAYALCEWTHYPGAQAFLRSSFHEDSYNAHGERIYFRPISIKIKVQIPPTTNQSREHKSISSVMQSSDMRLGHILGEQLPTCERVISIEFSRRGQFTVSAKQAEY